MELIETKIENGLQLLDQHEADLNLLAEQFKGLTIKGVDDKLGFATLRDARITLKSRRIQIEKDGKALRENAVKFQKRVIEREKQLIAIIEPTENALYMEEKRIEEQKEVIRLEKERKENERIQNRVTALAQFSFAMDLYELKIMPDAEFTELLLKVQDEYNQEQQRLAEVKAEEEKQRQAEQERIRLEREEFARQKG
jgi:hypothetical protein